MCIDQRGIDLLKMDRVLTMATYVSRLDIPTAWVLPGVLLPQGGMHILKLYRKIVSGFVGLKAMEMEKYGTPEVQCFESIRKL